VTAPSHLTTIPLAVPSSRGLKRSPNEEAFICQKKNHFQCTVSVKMQVGNANTVPWLAWHGPPCGVAFFRQPLIHECNAGATGVCGDTARSTEGFGPVYQHVCTTQPASMLAMTLPAVANTTPNCTANAPTPCIDCLCRYGIKTDTPSQKIGLEQSQSDRTKKDFQPVPIAVLNNEVSSYYYPRTNPPSRKSCPSQHNHPQKPHFPTQP